jgi:type I restriction enzyme S subunit
MRFVSAATFKQRVERLVPNTDDIIFAREGTVGTAVAIPADVQPCLGQRVMLLRSAPCITPRYFETCLNSQVVRAQYSSKIVGSTAPHINVAEVKVLAIPLPPLPEQGRIVAEVERRLSVVDELDATVSANLQRASRLRQAVLQSAFSQRGSTAPSH